MAETQQVIIEFVTNDEQLDSAIDKLEKTGVVDSKLAQDFKKNTSEISKQAVEIQKTAAATTPLKKSLEDVARAVKNTTSAFATGFHDGVQEALKEAGVSISELKQKLGLFNKDSPFEKLSKSVIDARTKVLNITAAMAQLKRTGGVDTEQFKKLEKLLIQRQAELSKLQEEYDEVTSAIERQKNAEDEAADATESLRRRLKELTQQIAAAKLAGEDNTEQFKEMVIEAGNIKDAIGDAAAEIKNASSDTKTFDNLLGSAQAVAGGFAVAQGAVALFGEENKDLEKTMLKVNAAIAVTQGLQSISSALEKEGALSLLATNIQLKVKNAQKVIETGLESQSIVVRGAAIVAQKALNAAMAANPIGIMVVAVTGLIAALAIFGRSASAARQQTANLNVALGQGAKNFEEQQENIRVSGENLVNALENQGAVESKIAAQRLETDKQLAESRKKRLKELQDLQASNTEADLEAREKNRDEIRRLQDETQADNYRINNLDFQQKKILREEDLKNTIAALEAQLSAAEEGSKQQLNLQKQLISARSALELNADGLLQNERAAIIAKSNKERLEAEAAFNKRRIDLQLQSIEAQLVNVREGSQEELDLKKKQLSLQTQSELTSTKLSEKEKLAVKELGFQNQLKLQKEYNARIRREAIENQISVNEAQISQIKTNDEDRLILQIANIELAAAAEVDAAKGNSAKIKEINAKRDADILAVKKKFIDDAAQYEIDIRTADNGPSNRALQRIVSDEKKGLKLRLDAIKQLAAFQNDNIDIQLKALEEEKNKKLISEKDYILKYKQLQDKKKEITEESEKATTDLIKAETIERVNIAVTVANQLLDLFQSISDTESQKENDRLEGERQRVAELLESGAITEREAAARNKRLDVEEKKIKQQQAQREKNIAAFRAFLAIPQAFLQGLAQGGPVVGAIYAAIAAAQAVIIASRPLPRFGHGKKSGYEGPAEIGETGPELYTQNGQMLLADKKQIVWLAAKDKVYNPTETKEILMPKVDKDIMQWQPAPQNKMEIDYDKLGKAVGKHINIPGFNIDEEGFKIWEQKGQHRKNYMDKRYSSK